ncbi:collagen type IV alpha-3-binding protein-like protein [Dinothrombium tinctorium]|uniref:Ceramide transfer protein n=1 Tax=Dinothrombium tinctorium TaxID=1965070 RepID=A0A3S3SBE5_9ACAR|nr:collagen type IV alpha-3-binding protein-like protein [Dinothrombium tinctorium]
MSENQSLSSDDEYTVNTNAPCVLEGTLSKWTNYIHGWQQRFISLSNGTLSYYKSENETSFGCRGALSIYKSNVKVHEFDECRFDVNVGDCVWYLRAENEDERNKWVDAIEAHKQFYIDSAYGSDINLRRHGSALSLGSISVTSIKKGRGLRESITEIETFRDILCRQIDTLQFYFDTYIEIANKARKTNGEIENENAVEIELKNKTNESRYEVKDADKKQLKELESQLGAMAVDLRGEGLTFKATSAGIISTLSQCIELMQQREENWKRKLEKEVELRKKLEESLKNLSSDSTPKKLILLNGPDYEEGPHSKIKEEEFFDALDAMLDKQDQEQEEKRQLKLRAKENRQPSSSIPLKCDHPLWCEIDKITIDQLYYARLEVGEGEGGWQLFAEEGEMRLYKRELEIDGLVCDPLKAVHTVKGITGHEVCYHFFSPDVRWEWENTLESMRVIEEINENTLIFHQIHKRVWPAAQRDAVFWSHIRRASDIPKENQNQNLHDIWIVCNNSTDAVDVPLGRCVRMKMTVSLTCETYIEPPANGCEINRDNLTCKIIYCSTINPGGWAPASVLRALYKREYPKFLKRFTEYVIDAQEKKPIMF